MSEGGLNGAVPVSDVSRDSSGPKSGALAHFSMFSSPAFAAAMLAGLVLAVFGRSLNYAMINYDSARYIVDDHAIHRFDFERISYIFKTFYFLCYIPVQRFSYMLDYALWGTNPAGYRAVNFLCHGVAAFFLFRLMLDLTKRPAAAWFVTLVFLLHPSRVESVVWLAGRKDVLSAAFGFAALWLYRRSQIDERADVRKLAWSVFLYGLALMSKPQWVSICAVLPFLDLYERRALTKNRLLGYGPFFALAGLFAWLTVQAQFVAGGKHGAPATPVVRAAKVLTEIGEYLRHIVWPVNLVPRNPETEPTTALVITGGVFLLACAVGALVNWRGRRTVMLGAAWFFIALAPMLNLVPVGLVVSDRFLYVAIVGAAFPVGVFISHLSQKQGVAILGATALVMASLTLAYLPKWKDDITLWRHAASINPDGYVLGSLLDEQIKRREFADAEVTYQRGMGLKRHYLPFYAATERLFEATGRDAAPSLQQAIDTYPNSPDVQYICGNYLRKHKNFEPAEELLGKSFAARPSVEGAQSLAELYAEAGNPEKGVPPALSLLNDSPFNPQWWLLFGRIQERCRRPDLAGQAYRQCLNLDPANTEARDRLAALGGKPAN